MLGYSQERNIVFKLQPGQVSNVVCSTVKVDTKILRLGELTALQKKQLKQIRGKLNVLYLRFRYGVPKTYILLAYVGKKLVHVEWIVPDNKIKPHYPFISDNSYSIISCLTLSKFRGLGIYPSQIQKVVKSNIPAEMFWIWTASNNTPSLKGIRKAGGIKVGEFVQKKWLWGCMSHIEYFPEGSSNK